MSLDRSATGTQLHVTAMQATRTYNEQTYGDFERRTARLGIQQWKFVSGFDVWLAFNVLQVYMQNRNKTITDSKRGTTHSDYLLVFLVEQNLAGI